MPSRNGDPAKHVCEPDNAECHEEAEASEEGEDQGGHRRWWSGRVSMDQMTLLFLISSFRDTLYLSLMGCVRMLPLLVTVEEAPTSFSPFSLVDCTLLSHFSFNDFVTVVFPDLGPDLDLRYDFLLWWTIPFPHASPYSMVVSTFPLIANNRYLPSSSSLLSSHLGRHLLDSYINPPMYTLSP